jgi:hypothetical protein
MFRGGIADKSGNRFEARWLTHELIGLLDGGTVSITIEKIGDEEEGFEFVVEKQGLSEWHQCKRQTSATSWTIAALGNAGVVGNFAAKLAQPATQRCIFVSTDTVKSIKLLKEKRAVALTLAEFEKILSKNEMPHWQDLQGRLGKSGQPALDWLDRCDFHAVSEDMLEEMVAGKVAFWFKGDPDPIVAAIRTWVEQDAVFNRAINREMFLAFATGLGFEVKQYELDQTLPGRISNATQAYLESYGLVGCGLFAISRPETHQLVAALLDDAGRKTIALVGPAGSGKSVLIRDAVARIGALGHIQLAFRVDQLGEPLSLAQLGTAVIDVADSPAVVLEKLSGDRRVILYIDQADAVSQMSGRSAQMRRQIVDLVNQASRYPHIRTVFSCRTFDIENDHWFAQIVKEGNTLRIDVPQLGWDHDVLPVLATLGIVINSDNPRIRTLLSQPIGLSMAAQLAASGVKDLRDVDNLSALFERLLAERDRAVQERHRPGWSIYTALEAVAEAMSSLQELVAPIRVLDRFARARDILQQEGLIVVNGQRISLIHESLFDFLHARAFAGGPLTLLEFLTSDEQTLFRRTQVRQILSTERDLYRKRYLGDLAAMLESDMVRPHVRDLVLRWLGTVSQPAADEWEILERYASRQDDEGVPQSIGMVLFGQPGWFARLAERDVIANWLRGTVELQGWALNYLRSIVESGALLASILDAYLDEQPERAGLLLERMHWFNPKGAAPEIADVFIRALGMVDKLEILSPGEGIFEFHASWISQAPEDAARILGASLTAWYRLSPTGSPFSTMFENGTGAFSHLVDLAKARPLQTLEALLPAMAVSMQRTRGPDGPPYQDQVWYWRRRDQGEVASVEYLDVVRSALARIAAEQPGETDRLLAVLEPDTQITGLHLLLETVASNPHALAPLLVRHRNHTVLFEAGWDAAPAYSAARAIAATWDWLDPDMRSELEGRILALWPEFGEAKWALSLLKAEVDPYGRTPEQIRGMALHYLSLSGRRQWSVLRTIGQDRLSPGARERLRAFERKKLDPEEPNGIRIGTVQSPIGADRAEHMSDEAWLIAFGKFANSERLHWALGGHRGGANELSHVLQKRVSAEPDRFLGLLSRIPREAPSAFPSAIAMGLSGAEVTAERTERLFAALDDAAVARPDDRSLMWLVRATQGDRGPRTLAFLLAVATSSEEEEDVDKPAIAETDKPEPFVKRAFQFGHHLDAQAGKSNRGAALREIGGLAWENVESFKAYREIVEPLVGSDMPDYLHASLGPMLLAALKHDCVLAADWISRTSKACLTIFYTRNGRSALRWLDTQRPEIAGPIIETLAASQDPFAQAIGCLLVAQRSLEEMRWIPRVEALIEQGPIQRGTIAEVAVGYLPQKEHAERTISWLRRLFDDDDQGVRAAAADCFRRIDAGDMATYAGLYEAYVGSKYFDAERTYFLHRLENAPAAMDDIVLGLIEKSVTIAKSGKTGRMHGLYQIWDPLLRIYASCGTDTKRLTRCLDVIDTLVGLDAIGSDKLNALA